MSTTGIIIIIKKVNKKFQKFSAEGSAPEILIKYCDFMQKSQRHQA